MIRAIITLVSILLLAVLMTVTYAQDTTIIGPDSYPQGINPLTGLPFTDSTVVNRRPLNVKITNWPPEVRPQSGLNSADIVWEHLVEGGVTRFTAVFYSQAVPHIGPVRSARLVDIPLTRIYGSLFVHSGSSRGTLDRLRGDAVMPTRNFGGGPCPPLCRFPREGLAYEHTLYADTNDLYTRAAEIGLDTSPDPITGMAFSETLPSGSIGAEGINIAYRHTEVQWTYDEAAQRWLRSQDGVPHFDANTESQISAANILIIETDHIEQPVVSDGYWGAANYAFEVGLVGRGRIYLFRDGHYYTGEWRRENDTAPLLFFDQAGNVLPFKPGNTFVNLVPRWYDGYQLTFDLAEPLLVTVTTDSVILRTGPGSNYRQHSTAARGSTFVAAGRNGDGSWVQVSLRDGDTAWLAVNGISASADLTALPASRSTYED